MTDIQKIADMMGDSDDEFSDDVIDEFTIKNSATWTINDGEKVRTHLLADMMGSLFVSMEPIKILGIELDPNAQIPTNVRSMTFEYPYVVKRNRDDSLVLYEIDIEDEPLAVHKNSQVIISEILRMIYS